MIALLGRSFQTPPSSPGAVLRACGLAAAPALLLALRGLPIPAGVGAAIWWVAHGGVLLGLVAATRVSLRLSTTPALLVTAMALAVGILALYALTAAMPPPP